MYEPGDRIKEYFEPFMDEKDGIFLFAREKTEVIEREIDLCGYFCIVTSQKMTAKEALELYKRQFPPELHYFTRTIN